MLGQQGRVDEFRVSLVSGADAASWLKFFTTYCAGRKAVPGNPRCRDGTALIDAPGLRYFLELDRIGISALRAPEEQIPLRVQREMKQLEYALLRLRFEVDQQIAATDQIDPRERGIGDQVLRREKNRLAQFLPDLIPIAMHMEKPRQAPLAKRQCGAGA